VTLRDRPATKKIDIVALTGMQERDVRIQGTRAGFDACCQKAKVPRQFSVSIRFAAPGRVARNRNSCPGWKRRRVRWQGDVDVA
jgi:CheY-like chemotaxis protein